MKSEKSFKLIQNCSSVSNYLNFFTTFYNLKNLIYNHWLKLREIIHILEEGIKKLRIEKPIIPQFSKQVLQKNSEKALEKESLERNFQKYLEELSQKSLVRYHSFSYNNRSDYIISFEYIEKWIKNFKYFFKFLKF